MLTTTLDSTALPLALTAGARPSARQRRLTGSAGDGVRRAVPLQQTAARFGERARVAPLRGVHAWSAVEPAPHLLHTQLLLGAERCGEEVGARTLVHADLAHMWGSG